jgi:hypothetical protein
MLGWLDFHCFEKIKWATKGATFTYSGKEVRTITKLFRDTQIKIAFRTKNTVPNLLKPYPHIDKYSRSGIYQMKCLDCPLKYIGQTGTSFNIRYKEHIQAIRNNNNNSGYSNHILNTGHTYWTINDTMDNPHCAHRVYLCVPYGSHNKQRLFPQIALTGWAL